MPKLERDTNTPIGIPVDVNDIMDIIYNSHLKSEIDELLEDYLNLHLTEVLSDYDFDDDQGVTLTLPYRDSLYSEGEGWVIPAMANTWTRAI